MSSNHNIEITPSNVLSDGKISFKNGNPVISFIIGEQDRLLISRSVRLCGKFRCKLNEDNDASDIPRANDELQASGKLGVYGAIDQLVIKSQQTHQVIEHIKYYNRMMASYLPQITSKCDATSHLTQSSLIMPNHLLYKQSVIDNPAQTQSPNSFCIPLSSGLFSGTADIPLSSTWGLKGLLIEIHLAPDTNFLYSGVQQGPAEATNPDGDTTGLTDSFYELSDVKLVAETIDPTPQQLQSYPPSGGTFEYNSISTYFTSVNSTNAIINFNLGLKRVMGAFMNFIPSSRINSYSHNGLATVPLFNSSNNTDAPIEKLTFLRGGSKFPLDYDIDYLGIDGLEYKEVDSQVVRHFINSVSAFPDNDRLQTSSVNTFERNNRTSGKKSAFSDVLTLDGGNNFGVGIAYDTISDAGVDFSTQAFGVQMTTGLTSDTPHAVYLFAKSKQTIAYSGMGLQVLM